MNKNDLLKDITKSNEEMLRYFTGTSNTLLQSVQDHQTELFEINIKLDELYRTKNIYSPATRSRKNVFSPIIKISEQDEKENEINSQINDLKVVKETLENKISDEEREIRLISEKYGLENDLTAGSQTGCHAHHIGFGDTHIEMSFRKNLLESIGFGGFGQVGVKDDYPFICTVLSQSVAVRFSCCYFSHYNQASLTFAISASIPARVASSSAIAWSLCSWFGALPCQP